MDCCKYGEVRAPAHAQYGAGASWEGYYSPLPYSPYAHAYYAPHAHDPYARYYRYDYPAHTSHTEHVLPMDYGAYTPKEPRVRRSLSRRERPLLPPQHPQTPTPPLECGINGRGATYCEPQMWNHYQMGALGGGGWNSAGTAATVWARGSCLRDQVRYSSDYRPVKGPQIHAQTQACLQEGRSTPYRGYEDSPYNGECSGRQRATPEFPASSVVSADSKAARERFYLEPRRSPPEEKRPPVVPLPAFQQAFGSTEIGKFAEAFSRTEIALDDTTPDSFSYESFSDWESSVEPQWSSQPASREIKCEDNY
ncbi:hypothetical protein ACJJTC_015755 [Scirpophaga incertulas]